MNRLKQSLNNFMAAVRKDNPNANWGNLLTGIAILVLIAGFSIWYFGNTGVEKGGLLNEIFNGQQTEETNNSMVTVEAGEGLWQVALRVCGNGELYNRVAEENGLTIWSKLETGQKLTVTCNY